MRGLAWAALAVLGGLVSGCATGLRDARSPAVARFFLESARDGAASATLPQSEVTIPILSKPVFTEFDLAKVEVAEVELGRCLLFRFTPAASRDLYRLTASNQGRRLVLVLNGQPLGARRIEGPFDDGAVLIFVERPDEELSGLASDVRATIAALQEGGK